MKAKFDFKVTNHVSVEDISMKPGDLLTISCNGTYFWDVKGLNYEFRVSDSDLWKNLVATGSIKLFDQDDCDDFIAYRSFPKYRMEGITDIKEILTLVDEDYVKEWKDKARDESTYPLWVRVTTSSDCDEDEDEVAKELGLPSYSCNGILSAAAWKATAGVYSHPKEYYLELLVFDDFIRVFVKYQSILGNRWLCEIPRVRG